MSDCYSSPCANGALCIDFDAGGFICDCNSATGDWAGELCDEVLTVVPSSSSSLSIAATTVETGGQTEEEGGGGISVDCDFNCLMNDVILPSALYIGIGFLGFVLLCCICIGYFKYQRRQAQKAELEAIVIDHHNEQDAHRKAKELAEEGGFSIRVHHDNDYRPGKDARDIGDHYSRRKSRKSMRHKKSSSGRTSGRASGRASKRASRKSSRKTSRKSSRKSSRRNSTSEETITPISYLDSGYNFKVDDDISFDIDHMKLNTEYNKRLAEVGHHSSTSSPLDMRVDRINLDSSNLMVPADFTERKVLPDDTLHELEGLAKLSQSRRGSRKFNEDEKQALYKLTEVMKTSRHTAKASMEIPGSMQVSSSDDENDGIVEQLTLSSAAHKYMVKLANKHGNHSRSQPGSRRGSFSSYDPVHDNIHNLMSDSLLNVPGDYIGQQSRRGSFTTGMKKSNKRKKKKRRKRATLKSRH